MHWAFFCKLCQTREPLSYHEPMLFSCRPSSPSSCLGKWCLYDLHCSYGLRRLSPPQLFYVGLGFLLLEIYPICVEEIPQRMLATLFGIACTTGFVYLMRRIKNESVLVRDRTFIMKSFDDIGFQLVNLSNGEKAAYRPSSYF